MSDDPMSLYDEIEAFLEMVILLPSRENEKPKPIDKLDHLTLLQVLSLKAFALACKVKTARHEAAERMQEMDHGV